LKYPLLPVLTLDVEVISSHEIGDDGGETPLLIELLNLVILKNKNKTAKTEYKNRHVEPLHADDDAQFQYLIKNVKENGLAHARRI